MSIVVSGSIVLYKTDIHVKKAITDFLNTSLPVKLFLIDNSPSNKLQQELADLISDERVMYIFNNANLGYGAAHNIALCKAIKLSKYHVVLNPDVSFGEEVLESLYRYAEGNPEIGLLTPRVLYPDGNLQYVCKLLPTPLDLIFRRFLPGFFFKKRNERFEMRFTGYNKTFEAPYIHGCFVFLRTSALKQIGLFDERFFMYPEDIDLTRRMHREYKTIFYPKVQITHAHAKGSYKNLRLLRVHIINMVKYFNKWGWLFDKERREVNKTIVAQYKPR